MRHSATAKKEEAHERTKINGKAFLYCVEDHGGAATQHCDALDGECAPKKNSRQLTSIGFGKTRRLLIFLRLTTECGSRLMVLLCICSDSILCEYVALMARVKAVDGENKRW